MLPPLFKKGNFILSSSNFHETKEGKAKVKGQNAGSAPVSLQLETQLAHKHAPHIYALFNHHFPTQRTSVPPAGKPLLLQLRMHHWC